MSGIIDVQSNDIIYQKTA